MKWIKELFGGNRRAKKARARQVAGLQFEPGGLRAMGDIPRYPPFTEGLPAATPEALLDTQEALIRQLKHELALTPEQNKALVDPLLVSYASFVHLLPASKAHHHRGAGGMLRHGLEVALWATRGFHTKIIDGHESGERRKVLEPRWRLAVAVAGLCHDIGKTAYDVTVTDPTGKKIWDVYGSLLSEWIEAERLDRYFISWRGGREHKVHERFGHLLTMRVIPREVLSFLNEGDPRIIAVMHETIAGQIPKGAAKVVHELVMAADQRSVQRDIKGQRVADSDSALGVPVAKYLVDAMKRLIDQGEWKANQEGQPLWVTGEGVFLDWEAAVPAITELLLADGISGIPRSQDSVAESLSDFDVITKQVTAEGNETYYVPIAPEKLCSKKKVHKFKAVELSALDILFDGPHPAPVEIHIGAGAIEAREAVNEKREKKLAEDRNDRALKRHEEKMAQADGESRPVMPKEDPKPESNSDAETPKSEPIESEADDLPMAEPADMEFLSESRPQFKAPEEGGQAPLTPEKSWIEALSPEQKEVVESCCIPGQCPHAHAVDGEIVVKYPDALAGYGDERNAKLEAIKPLLAPHPTVPEKPTQKRKIAGKEVNALVLNGEAAEALQAMATEAPAAEKPAPKKRKPTAKSEKSEAKPKTRKTPAKQQPKAKATEKKAEPEQSQASPEQEGTPEAKPRRAKPKADKAPAAKKAKPKPQQPPKTKPAQSPMIAEIKEKVLEAYPKEKIEDRDSGGYWISAPEAADWFVSNVRPDMNLGPVLAALYRLKGPPGSGPQPPNEDQDYVLVK